MHSFRFCHKTHGSRHDPDLIGEGVCFSARGSTTTVGSQKGPDRARHRRCSERRDEACSCYLLGPIDLGVRCDLTNLDVLECDRIGDRRRHLLARPNRSVL